MSYQLYDANGFVDDLASNMGLEETALFVDKSAGVLDLKAFFDKGVTTDPKRVIDDISFILGKPMPNSVKSTLRNLQANLQKVVEVAIIHQ